MRKRLSLKGVWQLLKKAGSGFADDNVMKLSGSLAYFTIFSIGPMIIIIIFFADLFWGREAVEGTIYGQINGLIGADAAKQVQEVIKNATLSSKSTMTAVIGFITLFIGATGVFAEIQDSINTIWGLKPKPKKGWLKMLMNRLLSFSVVVSLGFLLLVSLIINGLLEALSRRLMNLFPDVTVIFTYIVNLIITFIVTSLLFGIIFKVLPDARIRWKDVLIGAMATAALFMIGKFGISFYIGSANVGSTYGAAGSMVVMLVWVYYSAVILYFGAEFTKAYASVYGTPIKPNDYAVWIKHVEVEQEKGLLQQQGEKKEVVEAEKTNL